MFVKTSLDSKFFKRQVNCENCGGRRRLVKIHLPSLRLLFLIFAALVIKLWCYKLGEFISTMAVDVVKKRKKYKKITNNRRGWRKKKICEDLFRKKYHRAEGYINGLHKLEIMDSYLRKYQFFLLLRPLSFTIF